MRSLSRRPVAGVLLPLVLAAVVLATGAKAHAEDVGAAHSLGLYDPSTGMWYLRRADGETTSFRFGSTYEVPLVGDWDGDGIDTAALYRPGDGRVRVRSESGEPAESYRVLARGVPVAADLDGDGVDSVYVATGGRLYSVESMGRLPGFTRGTPVPPAVPGGVTDLVAGDWDGDGIDEIGAVGRSVLQGVPVGDGTLEVGTGVPVAGDWDGDGTEELAVYYGWSARFVIYHELGEGGWSTLMSYGATGMIPVAGYFGDLPGGDEPPEVQRGIGALQEGDSGDEVRLLQTELTDLGLYRSDIDGEYGLETAYAVLAFHYAMGLPAEFEWNRVDSLYMSYFRLPPVPDRPEQPHRLEVDIGNQLIYLLEDNEVTQTFPTSTGGEYSYYSIRTSTYAYGRTPRGEFRLYSFYAGWSCDPLYGWCIHNPWGFTDLYALHGYDEVPPYPASHGCVRLTVWDSSWIAPHLYVGMPMFIWDEPTDIVD
jgi:N-acetylmuramoyl-L-alanine amidase